MKIIIYFPISVGHATPETADHQPVSTLASLLSIIHFHPSQDIEGVIWPEAINLPEFKEILQAIYNHKKKIWFEGGTAHVDPPHTEFAKTMLKKFNIILWRP